MNTKRAAVLVPLLLVVMAGAIRLVELNHPQRIFFDETYYVNDAKWMLQNGVEEGFAVHPPMGKWLIGAGISALGDNPWGWRLPGVIAGSLVVLVTYLIALRLLHSRGAAALAGLLVAVDGLLFVQSRTSMLDVFLGFFVALGAWLLLVDFDRRGLGAVTEGGVRGTTSPRRPPDPLGLPVPAGGSSDARPFEEERDDTRSFGEPGVGVATVEPEENRTNRLDELPVRGHIMRVLAGAAFGLALATKWSGLLALATGGLLTLGWELACRRRLTGRVWIGLGSLVGSLTLAFLVVPAVVYVLSYAPWFVNYAYTTEGAKVCTVDGQPREPCEVTIPSRIAGFYRYQASIASFHANLEAEHSYRSYAYTWPVIGRPVVYYWEYCPEERAKGIPTKNEQGQLETPPPCNVAEEHAGEIIALGNPGLWWLALAAVVPLAIGAFRRDRRAWYIVSFWGLQFAPWLLVPRPSFFFYMVPIVPFLALANAYAITWIDQSVARRRPTRAIMAVLIAIVAAVTLVLLVAPWYTASPRPTFWSAESLPWRIVPGMAFLFYMTPVVPFLALAIAYARGWRVVRRPRHRRRSLFAGRPTPGTVTGAAIAVTAVALFVWFYPVYSGLELPYDEIHQRWWFDAWI